MRFKKVYIEITNGCNLNCSFCIHNSRKVEYMSLSNFKLILDKIKPFTNYIYLHVLGEPLLHPRILEFIEYASSKGFFVNITTNGYMIDKLIEFNNIRQVNISLHSYDLKYKISLDKYLDNIFNVISNLNNTYFSLRLWVDSNYNNEIYDYICNRYKVTKDDILNNKIGKNIFFSQFHEFSWPDLNNDLNNDGKCYGLIDHIGILVDGTVVPCCLDSKGIISLGNIFTDQLNNILSSERVLNMINGFKNGKRCEELCKHCGFFE